jgi:hypothetical protein
VAVKGKGKAKAIPPRPAPIASSSTSVPAPAATDRPQPLRVAALVTKPSRTAPRPGPSVESHESRHTAQPPYSRHDPSPKRVSPKKVDRPTRSEPIFQAAPVYRSAALAPLPTRPDIAPFPLHGRSASHTILPTVNSSTSISDQNPTSSRATRPLLPQSYSTTALPSEPSTYVGRFATGPMRIVRQAPISSANNKDDNPMMISADGFLYTSKGTTIYEGPSRPPPIHLGHGRKAMGAARRVVTAPTPIKELGYPARTPAASRTLARSISVKERVEEVGEQPISVFRQMDNPCTPAPPQMVSETKTPASIPITTTVDSPILPVLPPTAQDVGEEDLKDISIIQGPVDTSRDMESPVPVEFAALIPLPPDDVDEVEVVASSGSPIGGGPMVDEALDLPAASLDELTVETTPIVQATTSPIPSADDIPSAPKPSMDQAIIGSSLATIEATSEPGPSVDGPNSVPVLSIDETIHIPLSTKKEAVPEAELSIEVKEPTSEPVSSVDRTIPVSEALVEKAPVPLSTVNSTQAETLPVQDLGVSPTEGMIALTPAPPIDDVPEVSNIVQGSSEEVEANEIRPAIPPPLESDTPADSVQAANSPVSSAPPATTSVVEVEVEPVLRTTSRDSDIVEITGMTFVPATETPIADQVVPTASEVQTSHGSNTQAADQPPIASEPPIRPAMTVEPATQIADQALVQTSGIETKNTAPSRSKTQAPTGPISKPFVSRPPVRPVTNVKTTASASTSASVPPRKPPVPRAAAISRPTKPVERKTFRPVTSAQTAAATALAKVRTAQAQAQAQAQAENPRAPSRTARPPAVEPRSRLPSATSSTSQITAPVKTGTDAVTVPPPVVKPKSTLLAPTKASASRAAPIVSHPAAKTTTSTTTTASSSALPPVRKERIKLKAALPSFRPVRSGAQPPASGGGPGRGTWIASSTSNSVKSMAVPRAAAIPLPHSPVALLKSRGPKPELMALPPSPPAKVRPEAMPLPSSPLTNASIPGKSRPMANVTQPHAMPLPASPTPQATEVPLPDSPISSASHLRSRIDRAGSPSIAALQARLISTPSRNSSAPTMSDRGLDSEEEEADESAGVTFKVKSDSGGRSHSSLKMKVKPKVVPSGDLMEFSAPARMDKIFLGSTTPMYTPGRKALVIRDANLASPLVSRKAVVGEE